MMKHPFFIERCFSSGIIISSNQQQHDLLLVVLYSQFSVPTVLFYSIEFASAAILDRDIVKMIVIVLIVVVCYSLVVVETTGFVPVRTLISSFRLSLSSIPSSPTTDPSCNTCNDGTTKASCDNNEGMSTLLTQLDGPVLADEITNQNLIKIVNLQCSDADCNKLVWKALGYGYDAASNKFVLTPNVFPKWAAKYPAPPDLIGVTRNYSPEVDKECRDASMNLMRSIPRDYKGGVRELEKEGFRGYKLKELTPNKTRRAQLVNWLIYYREKLWGKTFEQLREEKMKEEAKSEEIANLPSERNFQKLRLDEVETK